MTDEIRLTLPRERPFYGIAHLVLGGLAVRLDLTFETLEDLQLALENLLGDTHGDTALTVVISVDGEQLRASVGPFAEEDLPALHDAHDPEAEGVTIGRVLDTVVDSVEVAQRDGGHWIEMRKTVRRAA